RLCRWNQRRVVRLGERFPRQSQWAGHLVRGAAKDLALDLRAKGAAAGPHLRWEGRVTRDAPCVPTRLIRGRTRPITNVTLTLPMRLGRQVCITVRHEPWAQIR